MLLLITFLIFIYRAALLLLSPVASHSFTLSSLFSNYAPTTRNKNLLETSMNFSGLQ